MIDDPAWNPREDICETFIMGVSIRYREISRRPAKFRTLLERAWLRDAQVFLTSDLPHVPIHGEPK